MSLGVIDAQVASTPRDINDRICKIFNCIFVFPDDDGWAAPLSSTGSGMRICNELEIILEIRKKIWKGKLWTLPGLAQEGAVNFLFQDHGC